ncbi:MAG: hypothetical protein IRZ08_09225 [Frankia sp.]|nr:hypothetical protein [Frankia sp.]
MTTPDGPGPAVSEDTALLLRLMVAMQERDRRHLGDVFHDGPIQDFTAVLLSCAAVRRSLDGPAADRIRAIEAQLRDAIDTLHLPPPVFRPGHDARSILGSWLARRVRGPLTAELDARLDVGDPAPTRAQLAELLGALELLLLESDPLRPAAHVAVEITTGADGIALTLRVTPEPPPAALGAERATAERVERLDRVASVLGAQVSEPAPDGSWSASLRWPAGSPTCPNG